MSTSLDLAMMNNLATRSLSAVILTSLYFTVMLIGFLIEAKVFDSCLDNMSKTYFFINQAVFSKLEHFLAPYRKALQHVLGHLLRNDHTNKNITLRIF